MTTPNTLTARLRRSLTGLGLATLAVLSHAAPVTYKESVDGDLSTYGALKVMALDTGVNTVSGTMGISAGAFDGDSFAFTVAAGMELLSFQVVLTDLFSNFDYMTWYFNSGGSSWASGTELGLFHAASPGTGLWNQPLGAGLYNLSFHEMQGSTPSTANYVFSFNVGEQQNSVPEPSTLALLSLAALGLLVVRRRRPL